MKTESQLAKTYRCNARTVRRWRKAGAPLGDAEAMRTWLSGQRTLPPGTRTWLERAPASKPRPHGKPRKTARAEGKQGAGEALTRLEGAEVAAHAALQDALAGTDAARIRSARMHWLAVAAELRRYDVSVDPARRGGDAVAREHAEDVVASVAYWVHVSLRGCLVDAVADLAPFETRDALVRLNREAVDRWLLGLGTALHSWGLHAKDGCPGPLPEWARSAFERELRNHFKDPSISRDAAALVQTLELVTQATTANALGIETPPA